ncbi:hypothetical protein [Agaribacter marinus]|uniref:Ig-like domain (Group 2) n=1 Tax=Agaribacter marinus TaxID=1431249 RepID=A0AA37WHF0_9ALTE|nr:hypothetical protein [Agaribacter marinus]GLR69812.1 hypothetical protein GCM10007852_07200 [Agaribacter marinus]
MNTNLLKKLFLATAVATALAGCGGADEGFQTGLTGTAAVSWDGPRNIELDEVSGTHRLSLLDGANLQGTESVIIRSLIILGDNPPPPLGITFNGTDVTVNTDEFLHVVEFGNAITYEYEYIIENGKGAPRNEDGTEQRRKLNITLNGVSHPVESFTLSEQSMEIPPTNEVEFEVSGVFEPFFSTNQAIDWTLDGETLETGVTIGNEFASFTVLESGSIKIVGITEGMTELVGVPQDDPTKAVTLPIEVTNNFTSSYAVSLHHGVVEDSIGKTLTLADCSAHMLSAVNAPAERNFADTITWSSTSEKISIMPMEGLTEDGSPVSGAKAMISIADGQAGAEVVQVTANSESGKQKTISVKIAENVMCDGLLNSDFSDTLKGWYWKNKDGLTSEILPNVGIEGDALHITGDGSASHFLQGIQWDAASEPNLTIRPLGTGTGQIGFSGWVKNLGGSATKFSLELSIWTGSWATFDNPSLDVEVSDEWQFVSGTFDAPLWGDDTSMRFIYRIPQSDPAVASDLLIDNVALYKVQTF